MNKAVVLYMKYILVAVHQVGIFNTMACEFSRPLYFMRELVVKWHVYTCITSVYVHIYYALLIISSITGIPDTHI